MKISKAEFVKSIADYKTAKILPKPQIALRITSYNVCYTKLLRALSDSKTAVGKYETMIESLTERKASLQNEIDALKNDETIYSNSRVEIQANIDSLDADVKSMHEKANELLIERDRIKSALADAQILSREKGVAFKSISYNFV